ncbi:MAG: MerR family transcriptional regulator [Berryella intestinalis]|uniref:MerR family transcriptional regulator n=1 Tax=Berryella intestinalis TaxID=1531429 RepID=UPI002A51851C|nr:MerR family transcriptional regulator [Berryella intestinalis]MDD7369829.1 MerR family transcriptional regulator [Berryella intestinalis]MDY3129759.1 MerR family transcriptional regulator [Berryella intestinalis]
MNIKETAERFGVSPDTLRYYERVGAIPRVRRTAGGVRDFSEEDLGWVETAVCFRSARLSVDALAEYVRLFRQGGDTLQARLDLLVEARNEMLAERARYDAALEKIEYKIARYEDAVATGVLDWRSGASEPPSRS